MRHCSNAVPSSKVVKGHMGQIPQQILSTNQSQVYGKNSNRTYKCRIVTTSRTFNGVSTNWKLNVYKKYKNYSYAQVVKCPRGGDSLAMPSMATSRTSPNQGKSGHNRVSGHFRDRISSHKNVNNNHTVTGRAIHHLDHRKGLLDHTCMDHLPTVKVSDHKEVIECTNRFHILQKGDVVSEYSCDAENTFHAQTDIIPGTGPNLDLKLRKASQSDAFIIINPRIGEKGKLKKKSAQVIVKHQGCQDTQAQRHKDEIVGNNSTHTRSSDANMNPKVESTNSRKYDLDLRHKV